MKSEVVKESRVQKRREQLSWAIVFLEHIIIKDMLTQQDLVSK
jgi:hypothetical protein